MESIETFLEEKDNLDNATNAANHTGYVLSFNAAFIMNFALHPSSEWNSQIFLYFFPIMFFPGIVGNIFSFATMCTARMRKFSYGHYLAVLAVYDSGMLIFNFLAWLNLASYKLNKHFVIFLDSTAKCKIIEFYCDVFMVGSAWTIVLVTLERFLLIVVRGKAKYFCKPKIARYVILVGTIIGLISSPWTASVTDYLPGYGCRRPVKQMNADFTFSCFYYIYIPIAIIVIANAGIIFTIFKLERGIKSSQGKRVTLLILIISGVYLVLQLPLGITATLFGLYEDRHDVIIPAMDFARILLCCNYCCNFYIYILPRVGGKDIRKSFKQMFGCHDDEVSGVNPSDNQEKNESSGDFPIDFEIPDSVDGTDKNKSVLRKPFKSVK